MKKYFRYILPIAIFILLPDFFRAQTNTNYKGPVRSYTVTIDSINKVKYVLSDIYIEKGTTWIVKQANSILTKDSLLLYEKLYEVQGTGTIGNKYIEKITMYGELRNYKTLEFIGNDEYIIKRYNTLGNLVSKDKVKKSALNDEWDSKIYTGSYALEKGKPVRNK